MYEFLSLFTKSKYAQGVVKHGILIKTNGNYNTENVSNLDGFAK